MKKVKPALILILTLFVLNGFGFFIISCSFEKLALKMFRKQAVPQLKKYNLLTNKSKTIQNLIELDTIIDTNIPIEGFNVFPPEFVLVDENIFWVTFNKQQKCYNLHSFSLKTRKFETLDLFIDSSDFDKMLAINKTDLNPISLDLNKKYLVLRPNYEFIIVFRRKADFDFEYMCLLRQDVGESIFLKEDTLICLKLRYEVNEEYFPAFTIVKVDLKDLKLIDIKTMSFDNIEFLTFYPSRYFSFSPNRTYLLVANPLKPKYQIYKDFNLVSEIFDEPTYWKDYKSTYYDSISNLNKVKVKETKKRLPAGSIIFKLRDDFNSSTGNKIVSVEFISDTSFFVTFLGATPYEKKNFVFYCDIWKYCNNNWFKVDSLIIDILPEDKLICKKDNFYFLSGLFLPKFSGVYIASFQISAPSYIMFDTTKTYKQIFSNRDKFIEENGLFWQLYVYKWKNLK